MTFSFLIHEQKSNLEASCREQLCKAYQGDTFQVQDLSIYCNPSCRGIFPGRCWKSWLVKLVYLNVEYLVQSNNIHVHEKSCYHCLHNKSTDAAKWNHNFFFVSTRIAMLKVLLPSSKLLRNKRDISEKLWIARREIETMLSACLNQKISWINHQWSKKGKQYKEMLDSSEDVAHRRFI